LPFNHYHKPELTKRPSSNSAVMRIGLFSVLAGIIVIMGWVLDIRSLESIYPGFVSMKLNAAMCTVFLGIALVMNEARQSKTEHIIYHTLLVLVTLTGGITLLEYQFGFNAGIDQLFITDRQSFFIHSPFPGRMAYNSSVCFTLMGIGLLGLSTKRVKLHLLSQYLFHAVTVISGIALMGYFFKVSLLYDFLYISSMALHTAIVLFLLSIATSLLNPQLGITKLFKGKGIGDLMARRHFITLLLVLIFFGSLRIMSGRFHILSSETGISLLAVSLLLVSLSMIWITANWLNKLDNQRSKAEEEVRHINADLERRVEERSEELRISLTELNKSGQRYRSLFDQASDSIYVLNLHGEFVDVNESMCKMTGYTRDELLQMNVAKLVNAELLHIYPLIYNRIAPGKSSISERKIIKKDGTTIDVEVTVKKFVDERVLVIARNITTRKQMEAELRMAEVKFRTLAEKSMVGIYIVQKGLFTYVNPRFAEIFGYKPEDLIGAHSVETVIHPEYQLISQKNVLDRLDGSAESVNYEALCVKKDGSTNWVEFYGSRAVLEGEPTIIGSMIDITERKMADERIKTNVKFIRNMVWKQSHILRSPLANLKGLVALLHKNPEDMEVLDYIEVEMERMDAAFHEMANDSSADEMNDYANK
jgi:two-component system, sporulation sensor kinase E